MSTVLQDLRYGARNLIKTPGFALAAVLTLALGIGVNTSLFSVVNAVLLSPLPFPEQGRLVSIWENNFGLGFPQFTASAPNFLDWKRNRSFADLAAFSTSPANLTGRAQPERVMSLRATQDIFGLLGAAPKLGRAYTVEEDRPGAPQVAVISHALWERRFSADPQIIGKPITLDMEAYTIIGVLPRDLRFGGLFQPGLELDVWTPLRMAPGENRGNHFLYVLGRLKPDTTLATVQAEMNTLARQLDAAYPKSNHGWGISVRPLADDLVGGVRRPLLVLMAAVGFILLIGCANIANLLLARASSRRKEVAIRASLGASAGRLFRQLLTESILLSGAGGVLGLAVAVWATDWLSRLRVLPIPRLDQARIDPLVLAFTFGVSVTTALFFGIIPALHACRPDFYSSLNESGRSGTAGRRRHQVSNGLAVAEIALALVLLIGAGLMVRSLERLGGQNPGFRPDHLATTQVNLAGSTYPKDDQASGFYSRLLERLEGLPGVESAAVESTPWTWEVGVVGRPYVAGRSPNVICRPVSSTYLRTMGVPLLRGRSLTEFDSAGRKDVVLINETAARSIWPKEDPVGKSVDLPWATPRRAFEVVGVVADVKHFGLETNSGANVYFSHLQLPQRSMSLLVRARSGIDPLAAGGAVRNAVWSLDKDVPVAGLRLMDEVLAEPAAGRRAITLLLAVFSGLALLLAGIGIYGVIAYSVSQRTREFGIRLALGATSADVTRLVIRQSVLLAGAGIGLGIAAALALTRLIAGLLFGVEPTDPMTFGGVSLGLIAVALAASYVPVRRATQVPPVTALRIE